MNFLACSRIHACGWKQESIIINFAWRKGNYLHIYKIPAADRRLVTKGLAMPIGLRIAIDTTRD